MQQRALIVVPDLMFQPRIEAVARALGLETAVADTPSDARDGLAARPALVVVDLQARGVDADPVIRGARSIGAAVLAFGRHTDAAALREARRAGADLAVARSELFEQLPELIRQLVPGIASGEGA